MRYLIIFLITATCQFLYAESTNVESLEATTPTNLAMDELQHLNNQIEQLTDHNNNGLAGSIDGLVALYKELGFLEGEWNCSQTNQGLVAYFDCAYKTLNLDKPQGIAAQRAYLISVLEEAIQQKKQALKIRLGNIMVDNLVKPSTTIPSFHNLLCTPQFSNSEKLSFINPRISETKEISSGNKYLLRNYLDIALGNEVDTQIENFCVGKADLYISRAHLE